MNVEQKLLYFKEKITLAEKKKSEAEGSIKEILRQLKKLGYNTIEEAENELNAFDAEIKNLKKQEKEQIQHLENSYDWD